MATDRFFILQYFYFYCNFFCYLLTYLFIYSFTLCCVLLLLICCQYKKNHFQALVSDLLSHALLSMLTVRLCDSKNEELLETNGSTHYIVIKKLRTIHSLPKSRVIAISTQRRPPMVQSSYIHVHVHPSHFAK